MADRTESTIVIPAPPHEVIDVISDFDNYPEWAEVKSATILSENEGGWAEQVEFHLETGVIRDTYVLGYDWQIVESGEGEVSWELVRADVLKAMAGTYALRAVDVANAPEGLGTEVVYRLHVDVKIPMLGVMKRKAERTIIDTALKSLSHRVVGQRG